MSFKFEMFSSKVSFEEFVLRIRPDVSSQKVMFVVHVMHRVMDEPRVHIFPPIFHGLISHTPNSLL